MYLINEYLITDPNLKNAQWADRMVSELRRFMVPLVDRNKAEENMKYLLGQEDDDYVKSMFKENGKNSKLSFIKLSVIEKYRNILIAERDKAGIEIGLSTIDPTILEDARKHDIDMLRYKKTREAIISSLNSRIQEPEFIVDKSYFKGDIDSFEDMGLDSEEDDSINYFFATHWRLLQEIFGEVLLSAIVAHNKMRQNISFLLNDILAKKAIAYRVYVSEQSGELKLEYISPENINLIQGQNLDNSDSPAVESVRYATIAEIIHRLGNEFNPIEDYKFFVNSVNYHAGKSYTGLYDTSSKTYKWCNTETGKAAPEPSSANCLDYYSFMNFRLPIHYIEFKSTDSTYFKAGKSVHGNDKMYAIKKDTELKTEHYTKKVYSNEVTYKCYYIPSSGLTQRVFKFGKLFHQSIKGGEDEYSNYSICTFKWVGPTAVDIMKPYIIMINKAWAKFEWMVQRAKPDGRTYNYEALVQVASKMIKTGDNATKVSQLIKRFEEGINDIYTIPTVDGEKVGGGQNPYFDKKAGLSSSAKDFLDTIVFCNEKMSSDFGLSPLREAYSPSPNDGYKLNMEALKQSRNATEYISTMLLSMFNHIGSQILLISQDIIKYKTSLAYKFLQNLVGDKILRSLEQCNFAHHRMGIHVDSFNRDIERAEVKADARQAYQNKEISYEQYILITSIGVPSQAAKTLAYEKRRQEKLKAKEIEQGFKNQQALQQQKQQGEIEIVTAEKSLENEGKRITGEYQLKSAEATAGAQIKKKEMDIAAEDDKQSSRTNAKIDQMREKKALDQEQAF